ncbi:MAG: radical SAM protein [Alphaproteobacteria bacterium]
MPMDSAAENLTPHPQFPRIYEGYAYSYPHKSAYRRLSPPLPIREAWSGTSRDAVSLYVHVPFCGMRCGFCNLFTTANPKPPLVARFFDALERQAEVVLEELGAIRAEQFVIGGGTPTYLTACELERIFSLVERLFGVDPRQVATSVETSPGTATPQRIAALAARGIDRISIGAQSFDEWERYAMGRPQKRSDLEAALDTIRGYAFPVLNIDLIYGAANQTPESWRRSIRRALLWRPEEIHLYPLYVRPQTGLGGRVETWDAHRLALYRAGRDFLLSEGYEQLSMRCFRRPGSNLRDAGAEFLFHPIRRQPQEHPGHSERVLRCPY